MTGPQLIRSAEHLEAMIERASANKRLELQPEFSRVLKRLNDGGVPVPARMRNLEAMLTDEVIEARFDNMPV